MPIKLRWLLLLFFPLFAPLCSKENMRTDHFNIGAGLFNVVRTHRTWQYQVEYRWDVRFHNIRPLAGMMTTEKATLYFCAGAGWDIFLGKRLAVTPSFAPGLYFKGSGKSLHFPLEFRSSIEMAYIFQNKGRLGAQFYHISNASLGRKNPGAESLVLFYAIPIPRK